MKKMQCELCGSVDIVKSDQDCFQCQHCGCKYTLEQAKMLIGGVVEVVKGKAELERQLSNANAQIRYGAYEEADKIYELLAQEYPDQHIVWDKMMACRRGALLSGHRALNGEQAMKMFRILRRLCLSAQTADERMQCALDDELFWKEFCFKYGNEKNRIMEIDIFRTVYAQRQNGTMPMDCISIVLWDYLVSSLTSKIRNREYRLMSKSYVTETDTALLKCSMRQEENYPMIMLLEDMHPKFAEMMETGRKYAKQLNEAEIRMGMIRDEEAVWLKSGYAELEGLYVKVTFALQGIIFADYATYSSGIRPERKYAHKNVDISLHFDNLRHRKTERESIAWWNKQMDFCPYCGAHPLQEGLLGRKCRQCGRKIPKM